eukprot:CAMPEP_0177691314 /NCGR_PEP_ID=MMETSP0484_2-20121128/1242_1 /TAXON_ID=354590 /ORGANISM="Rhodomonas lens, Strain RHODO" /LENGTH=93 /DNA_ID=CAMNT_0019201933 /DNA_START=322 /DNA_END=600 /DNA_ORIENTATION=+
MSERTRGQSSERIQGVWPRRPSLSPNKRPRLSPHKAGGSEQSVLVAAAWSGLDVDVEVDDELEELHGREAFEEDCSPALKEEVLRQWEERVGE